MKKVILTIPLIILFISAYSQSCLPEGITFETQAQVDNFQTYYPGCTEIEGDVIIGGTFSSDISSLNGLNELTSIKGSLDIAFVNDLTKLTGLDNLESIGGNLVICISGLNSLNGLEGLNILEGGLSIYYVSQLEDLSGLDNLVSLGGNIFLDNMNSLTSIKNLENLTSIGGGITISENMALTNLTGLENLASVGEGFHIYNNNVLSNISALKNIDASTITGLSIYSNSSLSSCEAESICEYLASSNGYVYIDNNAPGCNSVEEVEEDCEDLSIKEYNADDNFILYPNPAHSEVSLEMLDGNVIEQIFIYSLAGQEVISESYSIDIIDISSLPPGMYIVEVTVEGRKVRQRLLIE